MMRTSAVYPLTMTLTADQLRAAFDAPEPLTVGAEEELFLLDRLIATAPEVLAPRGRLLLVHSSVCGEAATLAGLEAAGLRPEVIARRRGPLGPRLRERADMLRERGLLGPDEREEELLVIAGVAGSARRGRSVGAAMAAMQR